METMKIRDCIIHSWCNGSWDLVSECGGVKFPYEWL